MLGLFFSPNYGSGQVCSVYSSTFAKCDNVLPSIQFNALFIISNKKVTKLNFWYSFSQYAERNFDKKSSSRVKTTTAWNQHTWVTHPKNSGINAKLSKSAWPEKWFVFEFQIVPPGFWTLPHQKHSWFTNFLHIFLLLGRLHWQIATF